MSSIWDRLNKHIDKYNELNTVIGDMSGFLINEILERNGSDNLTVVIVVLKGFKNYFENTETFKHKQNTAQPENKNNKLIPNKDNSEVNLESIEKYFTIFNKQFPKLFEKDKI